MRQVLLIAALVYPLAAQRQTGELRLTVNDAAGLPLEAQIEVTSHTADTRRILSTASDGRLDVRELPFGTYLLKAERSGFRTHSEALEVRAETPIERRIVLGLGRVETSVTISDSVTLVNPQQVGSAVVLSRDTIEHRRSVSPGRGVLELVNNQPGWLLEANGVLHPRGSEYDTQYVIDGAPILDNRSPAFGPAFEPDELSAVRIITSGFPAEYGRKLGGVVELSTARETRNGFHGLLTMQAGSFETRSSDFSGNYRKKRGGIGVGVQGAQTDRFLDPPIRANFTNNAHLAGANLRIDSDITDHDRLRIYVHRKQTGFLVPNNVEQQEAGQRQDRRNQETLVQFSYQRIISPQWLADTRFMFRDASAELWSNLLATPIIADQNRNTREAYWTGSLAATLGRHSLKMGSELALTRLREHFDYRITNHEFFEEDGGELEIPLQFLFKGNKVGREHSGYIQDSIRAGAFTINAGLRWDRYQLLVTENFVSPRLAVAWYSSAAGLSLRASYDRAITIPATENLLLASSPEARGLTDETTGLPLRPARGNYYEVGFSKALFGNMRLDGSWYRRNTRNASDDDVFLNTGISFPISFDRAVIRGYEARIELPSWGKVSGSVSYSNLVGTGYLPITGGLFLGEDARELLESTASFPVSQDQRNTLQARMRYELHPRASIAAAYSFNSGLPFEIEDDSETGEVDEHLTRRLDLGRGRVRPSYTFDLSGSAVLWQREGRGSWVINADVLNLADRFNLINYGGLFSGTAIGTPRSVQVRMKVTF